MNIWLLAADVKQNLLINNCFHDHIILQCIMNHNLKLNFDAECPFWDQASLNNTKLQTPKVEWYSTVCH